MIADSGNRTTYNTGAVRDIQIGKGRCDLLPLDIINLIVGDSILSAINQYLIKKDINSIIDAVLIFIKHSFKNQFDALIELSIHFEEGALKYGIDNWRRGIPENSFIDSAIRHYLKFKRGDNDERHDRACLWNLICLIWTVKNKSS